MKFYDSSIRQLIDFSQLLDLVRDAKIYSIAVVEVHGKYEVHAEVVTRELGIQRLTVKNHGHISFESEGMARQLLTQSLRAHDPRLIDWHLASEDGKHLLCGPTIEQPKHDFRTAAPDRFFGSKAKMSGPRCRRCVTQAYVFGLIPEGAEF
jgi:hypothetical protein